MVTALPSPMRFKLLLLAPTPVPTRIAPPPKYAPPLVIVSTLPEPELPTVKLPLLFQTEPESLMLTMLLLAPALTPMEPVAVKTVPLLAIVRMLPEPAAPTMRSLRLLQIEPAPVTSTALLFPFEPMLPAKS